MEKKCYINSCKYNVYAMYIAAGMHQIHILLLKFSGLFKENIFYHSWICGCTLADTKGRLYLFFANEKNPERIFHFYGKNKRHSSLQH